MSFLPRLDTVHCQQGIEPRFCQLALESMLANIGSYMVDLERLRLLPTRSDSMVIAESQHLACQVMEVGSHVSWTFTLGRTVH